MIYQIYPRSYLDTNGDGIGDLAGIRSKLDHLQWLGVDGIWLSPCFPSPMADFGYDVADYCDIDPVFGSLDDMDRLIAEAHSRDIRVILDWVPNHTSDRHPWFVESRSSRDHPKRDWYVWRDAGEGDTAPNNWKSVFGGKAWTWDESTGQYYLHSFLAEQPDLNWRKPELVEAMHDTLRFWLDRGVDGFRIDVIHKLAKDPALRSNPVESHGGVEIQDNVHNENHPDIHDMLRGIRGVLDEYEERMAVGEVYILDPDKVGRYYGSEGDLDQLHLAFNFSFLHAPWEADAFRREIERFEAALPSGAWPDVVLSNHDVSRHATRYEDGTYGDARARLAALMLLTLRGTPFLYYGEEIGMRDVPIAEDQILDPVGRNIHPRFGRDPERTPMQWNADCAAGFTTGTPWLPIAADSAARNVAVQKNTPDSLLNLYRELLALRRVTPALHRGAYRTLSAPPDVLAYERCTDEDRAVVALNFSGNPATVTLGYGAVRRGLRTTAGAALPANADEISLDPSEGAVLILD